MKSTFIGKVAGVAGKIQEYSVFLKATLAAVNAFTEVINENDVQSQEKEIEQAYNNKLNRFRANRESSSVLIDQEEGL